MNSDKINQHLTEGGIVQVTTQTRSTVYKQKHAGWFFVDKSGHLCVNHGNGSVSLGPDEAPWVSIRFGRMV